MRFIYRIVSLAHRLRDMTRMSKLERECAAADHRDVAMLERKLALAERGERAADAEVERLSHLLSCIVDHASGGRISKTNYEKQVYYTEIDQHVSDLVDEGVKEGTEEIEEELSAAKNEIRRQGLLLMEKFKEAAELESAEVMPGPNGGTIVRFRASVVPLIAAHLAAEFTKVGAQNFVAFELESEDLGPLVVTLQRRRGEEPYVIASRLRKELAELKTPRPAAEYHEDMGNVLWWRLPVQEPPHVGTTLDLGYTVEAEMTLRRHGQRELTKTVRAQVGGWTDDYYTHFTPLLFPNEPVAEATSQ